MSRQPVIKDFQGCSFTRTGGTTIDLAKYLTEWSDTREYDLGQHLYLKKAGGEQEEMGRLPHIAKVTLSFAGPTWYRDAVAFIAELDKGVKGTLVHPLFGKMRAACRGFNDAKMNLEQAAGLYVMPLVFVEDNIDTNVDAPQSQGVSAQQQQIIAYNAALSSAASRYITAAFAVTSLTAAAAAYATSAVNSALNQTTDPTLPGQLASIRDLAMSARDAVRADPADTLDAPRFTSVALIEQVLDSCRQLDKSIGSLKPTLTVYTVPARVHIAKLAHQFYGQDGATRIGEIMANNPGKIPDPWGIAAGTQLVMATPTAASTS